MRILRIFLVIAAVAAVLPAAVGAQETRGEFVNRLTRWMTIGSPLDTAPPPEAASPGPTDMPPRWLMQDPYCAEDLYCENGQCGYCNGCCRQMDVFGSVEFLMWWAKGTSLRPLLTTAPDNTMATVPGALDEDDTQILFGNDMVGKNVQAGGRVTAGIWLDPEHNVSLAGKFFSLSGDENRFTASSADFPLLVRPFTDADLGLGFAQGVFIIGTPGVADGTFSARSNNNNILGTEAVLEVMMHRDANRRVDLVAGYQFMRIDDSLIVQSTTVLPDTSSIAFTDRFKATNEFHGGEIGFRGRLARGVWSLDALGKVGIGSIHQQVDISGQTVNDDGLGNQTTFDQGFLALPSNSGVFSRSKFAFIPEVGINLKYHVSRNLNFHVGYNLIYISHVATTGDQIDLRLNFAQTDPFPVFSFRDDDYWLQGMNFGMNWDF